MSDEIKIQTTAPDELSGGQQPLSADAELYSRTANTVSQVFRGFPPAPEVQRGSAGPIAPAPNSRPSENVGGMCVSAPLAVTVEQVDHVAILGSNAGNDYRAKAADAKMPDNPAPRTSVGQTKISGRTPAPSAPQSFTGNLSDSDAGN